MENFYHIITDLGALAMPRHLEWESDVYTGKIIAQASMKNRAENRTLYNNSLHTDYLKLFRNKEKERIKNGLTKMRSLLQEGTFDPGILDRFIEQNLAALVRHQRFNGIIFVCDAVDTFYNHLQRPEEGYPLLGQALRKGVGEVSVTPYARDKQDITSLEYQAFLVAVRQKIKKQYGLF